MEEIQALWFDGILVILSLVVLGFAVLFFSIIFHSISERMCEVWFGKSHWYVRLNTPRWVILAITGVIWIIFIGVPILLGLVYKEVSFLLGGQ